MASIDTSVSTLSIEAARKQVLLALRTNLNTNLRRKRFVPFFWGSPGIGKSSIVESLEQDPEALAIVKEYGFDSIRVTSFRLSQCDPTDLKGVPGYERFETIEGKEVVFTSYAPPLNFPLKGLTKRDEEKVYTLFFLDELRQGTPVLQALATAFVDGKIGDHILDFDRCMIVVASNGDDDRAATHRTPLNVANRATHYRVVTSPKEWLDWATINNIHPVVYAYIERYKERLDENKVATKNEDTLVYGTPRSWENVSDILHTLGDWTSTPASFLARQDEAAAAISGTVGDANARQLFQHLKALNDAKWIEKIKSGKWVHGQDKADDLGQSHSLLIFIGHDIKNQLVEISKKITELSKGNESFANLTKTMKKEDLKEFANCVNWAYGSEKIMLATFLKRAQGWGTELVGTLRQIILNPELQKSFGITDETVQAYTRLNRANAKALSQATETGSLNRGS
jgi:hypothetical protein